MGGWIKLEKDLLTDPRLVAAAMKLEERYELSERTGGVRGLNGPEIAEFGNAVTLPSVTLVIGGLARLWVIADTHIGQDDVLALNVQQIDKLIGIEGFCEILPSDWLQILDGNRVKLPNYHEHNGTTAKERSANAERQARYRQRRKQNNVAASNAVTLPDLDRDKTEIRGKRKAANSTPPKVNGTHKPQKTTLPENFILTAELSAYATAKLPGVDPIALFESFRAKALAKGWQYVNWSMAFQEFVRNAMPTSGHFSAGNFPKASAGERQWQ